MMQVIDIPENSSFFETSLNGEAVKIDLYYSISKSRYLMDIENKRLNRKSIGITVNTGVDMLGASGRLGLEALMLVSIPQPFNEGSIGNFKNNLKLVYMDLQTYSNYVLQDGETRRLWIEQTPNGI